MAHRNLIIAALVGGAIFAWTKPASAQSLPVDGAEVRVAPPSSWLLTPAVADTAVPAAPVASDAAPVNFHQVKSTSLLSRSLVGLYASTAVLQALDARSTFAVIQQGGAEGNPIMAGLVAHPAAFMAVKVGIAASTILAARQMAKHSKFAAVVALVALNSVYASVVSHNFKLAGQLR